MHSLARFFACFLLLGVYAPLVLAQPQLTGVNLAGADFGEHELPGTYNQHYTYPTAAEVDYFVGIGMNVFRLPFRWERLQREAFADLDTAELARMDAFVHYATGAGAKVVLDPHNYARYYGAVIGSSALPAEAFGDFWAQLATQYADNEDVIFGLMNEPNTMATELWLSDANEAIAAIREAGATNLILVPGNGWTGAHSWSQNWYGTPNATAMQDIVDPLDNYAFDLHQYLDSNSSGTSPTCVSTTVGAERLAGVTAWLRQHGEQGFLGEFGAADNGTCLDALDDMLTYIDANADVWLGWTYWAAGPWWGDYMFSIEPGAGGNHRPQTFVLMEHLAQPTATEPVAPEEDAFRLDVWPNPALSTTTLLYVQSQPGAVVVTVFDLLGRQVKKIDYGNRPAGTHSLSLPVVDFMPGVYIVRLRRGEGESIKMVTVVR